MTNATIAWADPARASAFARWLDATALTHALQPETVRLASADASFRRYFRVDTAAGDSSRIIMDAPPAQEDCKPFVKVAALMADAGLNAPRVLAWDEAQGFMLLSDLGHQTLLDVINPPAGALATATNAQACHDLYMDAVEALITWQLASRPDVLPPYDDALLSRELALFPDWYVNQHRGLAGDTVLHGKLEALFTQIKASNLQSLGGARVYVHRDFMPRNLMVAQFSDGPPLGKLAPEGLTSAAPSLPAQAGTDGRAAASRSGTSSAVREATSVGALGILDFQDAVYGPITYDIASLMRDAFLSWEEDFVLDVTVRYWQKARQVGLPVGDDFGEFYRAVEWMGLQRHLKVLGIFARLTLRDGKPKYLADTPRFIKYARSTAARYRQLGPLMVLLDQIEGDETRVGYTF
ncbi:aminoglycoside phosphotransferase family protein [Polaromonas sp.]|uniref:aminoglycoside phosphotransferase family protein n=1 Tax=Polaromonas sp. TaxID=1869339 RepID=UPI002FCA43BC